MGPIRISVIGIDGSGKSTTTLWKLDKDMKYVNLNPGESHITVKVVYRERYLIEPQLGVKVGVFGSDNWMANLTKEPFEAKRVN